jgi:hypothetical protein
MELKLLKIKDTITITIWNAKEFKKKSFEMSNGKYLTYLATLQSPSDIAYLRTVYTMKNECDFNIIKLVEYYPF